MLSVQGHKFNMFAISDIFSINCLPSIDINKLKNGEGTIPYCSRTKYNNGVLKYVCDQGEDKLNKGNVICVCCNTQTVSYQSKDFYCCQHFIALSFPQCNLYTANFICAILYKILKRKFDYGYSVSKERLKKLGIKLPVKDDNNIDWEFMEAYMKERIHAKVNDAIYEIESRMPVVQKPSALDEVKEWRKFRIDEIFQTIKRGFAIKSKDRTPGNIPYVTASLINNGVSENIFADKKHVFSDCLTVPCVGGAKSAFYHSGDFIPSGDVRILENKNFDEYTYRFIGAILGQVMKKFSYGYKASTERLSRQTIPLPVTETGELDCEFMSDYMKTRAIKVFTKKIELLKQKLNE